jgi:uncharacterized protein
VVWTPVSLRLATGRRGVLAVWTTVPALALLLTGLLADPWWVALFALLPLAGLAWGWWVIGRQVAAIGYAEREDDLLVRRGVLFRTVVVVPYGRMQYVDVHSGPVDRMLGIARLQLHTASAGSDAHIPGLPADEASRLRDRLASRGEAQLAGL